MVVVNCCVQVIILLVGVFVMCGVCACMHIWYMYTCVGACVMCVFIFICMCGVHSHCVCLCVYACMCVARVYVCMTRYPRGVCIGGIYMHCTCICICVCVLLCVFVCCEARNCVSLCICSVSQLCLPGPCHVLTLSETEALLPEGY